MTVVADAPMIRFVGNQPTESSTRLRRASTVSLAPTTGPSGAIVDPASPNASMQSAMTMSCNTGSYFGSHRSIQPRNSQRVPHGPTTPTRIWRPGRNF